MKQNLSDYTIRGSRVWWLSAALLLLLALGLLVAMVAICASEIKNKEIGGAFFIGLMFLPSFLLVGIIGVQCIRSRGDYLQFSSKGVELCLHQVFRFWKVNVESFTWDQVEHCGVRVQKLNYGQRNYHLLIKLVGEDTPRQYDLQLLHGRGKEAGEALGLYAEDLLDEEMVHEETQKKKDTLGDYIVCAIFIGGIFSAQWTLSFYDHTFIAWWFWIVVEVVCLVVGFLTTSISKLKKGTHYLLAISIGMLLCCALLWVNYKFADWNAEPEVRTYKVVKSGFYTKDHSDNKAFIQFEVGDTYKKIDIDGKADGELLEAESLEFQVHHGALGFDVW